MKRGIDVHPDYDRTGVWCLIVEKKKGKLTLEDIKEAAREYEWDYYLLVLDCFHDPYEIQGDEMPEGDIAVLYSHDALQPGQRTAFQNIMDCPYKSFP